MNKRRRFLSLFIRLMIVSIASSLGWILFVYGQQWTYRDAENQLYLMGTYSAYTIVFLFLFVAFWMVASMLSHRKEPHILKKRFFWFAAFYLLCSPLVIFSFDNYLSLTKKGIQYNRFFTYEGENIITWDEIKKIEIDYVTKRKPAVEHDDIRLQFIVVLKNNERFDLNNLNSPLYSTEHFVRFREVFKKANIPFEIIKPLPKEFQAKKSYLYDLFEMKPPQ